MFGTSFRTGSACSVTTTVIITHNAIMADMADRVIHFSDGHVHHLRVNDKPAPPSSLEW